MKSSEEEKKKKKYKSPSRLYLLSAKFNYPRLFRRIVAVRGQGWDSRGWHRPGGDTWILELGWVRQEYSLFLKNIFYFFFISPVCAELPEFLSSRLVPCPRARDLCGIREEPPCPSIIYSTNGFVLLLVYSPISSAVNTGRRKKKSKKGKNKSKKRGWRQ